MIRVLIDSNVLISGLVFGGNESHLLELALSKHFLLLVPESVVLEVKRILVQKADSFSLSEPILQPFEQLLEKSLIIPNSIYEHRLFEAEKMIRDKKDAPILAAVLCTPHDFFVSGDKDFAALNLPTWVSVKELIQKIKAYQGL